MKLIFHIGMGKTGTSSIQQALRSNSAQLAQQKASYLGLWFDAIDPDYLGIEGQEKFFALDPAKMRLAADRFGAALLERSRNSSTETFLLSNENIFASGPVLDPFLRRLLENGIEVSLIAYLRNPVSWLPSAYTQWGVYHKTAPGPIKPYEARARELIGQYEGIRFWLDGYGDRLIVRQFEKGVDVVQDFGEAVGLSLQSLDARQLERSEPADILLRAMFNDRVPSPVLPERFNNVVVNTGKKPVPSLREMADRCFSTDCTEEIVAEKRELFEFIRDRLGMDFVDSPGERSSIPDHAELQQRVIDYLVEITLDQARRLKRLERLLQERD